MPEQESSNPLLYQKMDTKETEELLAIWNENDREAWTDEAFAAMHAVLLKRLGRVPEQGALFMDDELDAEEEETLSDSQTLALLAIWANRLAWLVLGVSLLLLLLRIVGDFNQPFRDFSGQSLTLERLSLWVSYVYSFLISTMYFVLLKAVSAGAHFLTGRAKE